MNYKDIISNIKHREFKNMYLFYGREFYLIENAIKVFKNTLNEGMIDFNLDIIDGKETSLTQVISSIETLPFMDDKKISAARNGSFLAAVLRFVIGADLIQVNQKRFAVAHRGA